MATQCFDSCLSQACSKLLNNTHDDFLHPLPTGRQVVKKLVQMFDPWAKLLALLASMLPAFSLSMSSKWDRVLYDCFSHLSLFLQATDTILMLGYHLMFVSTETDVMPYLIQVFLLLFPMYIYDLCKYYASQNLQQQNPQHSWFHNPFIKGNIFFLLFLPIAGFSVWKAKRTETYDVPLLDLFFFGGGLVVKIAIPVSPVLQRWWHRNFEEDTRSVLITKMCSTILDVLLSAYDLACISIEQAANKDALLETHGGKRFRILLLARIVTGICQVIFRLIGPERMKRLGVLMKILDEDLDEQ